METPLNIENKKKAITGVFDDVAPRYDRNRFFRVSAEHLLAFVDFSNATSMIDLTTGTGMVSLMAAERYPDLSVVGIDLSSEMLDRAKEKALSANLKNITFRQKDVEQLSGEPESVDIITCGYGLFFFDAIDTVVQSCLRLLKPSGQFVFSTFMKEAFSPYSDLFIDAIKADGIEVPALSRNRLETEAEILALCLQNGCEAMIQSQEIRYEITVEDWWNLINDAGYRGLVQKVKPQKLKAFKAQHLREVSDLSEEGMIVLKADSYYTKVIKG